MGSSVSACRCCLVEDSLYDDQVWLCDTDQPASDDWILQSGDEQVQGSDDGYQVSGKLAWWFSIGTR